MIDIFELLTESEVEWRRSDIDPDVAVVDGDGITVELSPLDASAILVEVWEDMWEPSPLSFARSSGRMLESLTVFAPVDFAELLLEISDNYEMTGA